jgi:hypothetical protein
MTTEDFFLFLIFIVLIAITAWWLKTQNKYTQYYTHDDLEAMNKAKIKSSNYKYCTIDTGENGDFLARVKYNDSTNSWGPSTVLVDGGWISIDDFNDLPFVGAYSCTDYRALH